MPHDRAKPAAGFLFYIIEDVISGRDGLLLGCWLHFAEAMTQMIKRKRGEATFGQAPHQREEIVGTPIEAMHKNNRRTGSRAINMDPTIFRFHRELINFFRHPGRLCTVSPGRDQQGVDFTIRPARHHQILQQAEFLGEKRAYSLNKELT